MGPMGRSGSREEGVIPSQEKVPSQDSPPAIPSAAEPGAGGGPDTAFHHLQTQKSPKWLLGGSPLLLTATDRPSHGNVTAGQTLQIGNENRAPYNKECIGLL